jgi:hypothetical protein
MTVDADAMPADARAVIVQLLSETEQAIETADTETASATLDTVQTVTTNKVPAGADRDLLLDGCQRVREALDSSEQALAVEYARSMREHVSTEST